MPCIFTDEVSGRLWPRSQAHVKAGGLVAGQPGKRRVLKTSYNDKGEELTEMVWEDDPNWTTPSQPSSAAPAASESAPAAPAAPAAAAPAASKKQQPPASGEGFATAHQKGCCSLS